MATVVDGYPGESTVGRRALHRLIGAEGISVAGDWVLNTAASIALYEKTGSTAAVSVLLGLAAVPTVLLGPFAGATADRYERRQIMVIADLLSGLVLALGIVASFAGFDLAAIYTSVFVLAVLSAFRRPASEALRPVVAGDEQISRANSMVQLATRLAMILGPATGAGLVAIGGIRLALGIDAMSFIGSAGLVAGVGFFGTPEGGGLATPFRSALDGLAHAGRSSHLRTVIGAIGITMLAAPIVNAGTLALVKEELHLPESRYGALLTAEGIGALALALLFTTLGPKLRLLPAGGCALIVTGGSTILLGRASNIELGLAAMALMGMGVVGLQIALATYLQRETPDEFRGRVMSLTSMTASTAGIVGFAITGPLVYTIGVRQAFVLAGVIICACAIPVLALAWVPRRGDGAPDTTKTVG